MEKQKTEKEQKGVEKRQKGGREENKGMEWKESVSLIETLF